MKTNKSSTPNNHKKSGTIPSCSGIIESPNITLNNSHGALLLQQGYMRRNDIRDILEKEGHDERNRQRKEGSSY